MILHPIIDLLKRIVMALPNYGGGNLPYLIKYEAIPVETDMLTLQTNGNSLYFQNTYLPDISPGDISPGEGYPTILILIDNTFTGEHSAQSAIRLSGVSSIHTTRMYLRSGGTTTASATNDFFIGAGSIIHRYVFVYDEE